MLLNLSSQCSWNSSRCGGPCAALSGGHDCSKPMLRSITSVVRRFVTRETTRRWPPQGHFHTSQPNVRCSNVAQSILGCRGFFAGGGSGSGGACVVGFRATCARWHQCDDARLAAVALTMRAVPFARSSSGAMSGLVLSSDRAGIRWGTSTETPPGRRVGASQRARGDLAFYFLVRVTVARSVMVGKQFSIMMTASDLRALDETRSGKCV